MAAARAVFDVHRFRDRRDAGQCLGARLASLAHDRPIVIGLPRGGVPVAYDLAADWLAAHLMPAQAPVHSVDRGGADA